MDTKLSCAVLSGESFRRAFWGMITRESSSGHGMGDGRVERREKMEEERGEERSPGCMRLAHLVQLRYGIQAL